MTNLSKIERREIQINFKDLRSGLDLRRNQTNIQYRERELLNDQNGAGRRPFIYSKP